jgi:hypothetical protein
MEDTIIQNISDELDEKVYYEQKLILNIKKKDLSYTSYGEHIYSDLWYVCNKNKLCITFTPRGGCSISFQQFLDLNGLLDEALSYNSFIHHYRCNILNPNISHTNINTLIENNYTFIKFILNPYIRAISIYRAQTSHNLSFRQYLKDVINNNIDYLNENDKYHNDIQYIDGEETIITKYIKIDKNETYQLPLFDGTLYILDVNRYSSVHHGIKNNSNTQFCGDLLREEVNSNLPKSYKYFYDDDIKNMVETIYKKDIEHYGYSFEDF